METDEGNSSASGAEICIFGDGTHQVLVRLLALLAHICCGRGRGGG